MEQLFLLREPWSGWFRNHAHSPRGHDLLVVPSIPETEVLPAVVVLPAVLEAGPGNPPPIPPLSLAFHAETAWLVPLDCFPMR